jgi:6-phosphogluconolactonase
MASPSEQELLVYIGTYTHGRSEGIYRGRLDLATGEFTLSGLAARVNHPSFLAIHPRGRFLYAVNEGDGGEGAVSAFSLDPSTGALTFLNQQSSRGAGPCHLSVDRTGRWVLVANYGSGSVALLPLQDDGRLGEATDFIQHEGASINPQRQEGPHAHSITLDPANRYALAADLGLDQIRLYQLDPGRGKLLPHDPPAVAVKGGAGPRHLAFHPNGRYVYLINELDNTLIAFAYEASRGALREIQTVSTLPSDFQGISYCADVQVAPSGRFVYGSNRGHDSIVVCAVEEATGRLTVIDYTPTQGKFPRHFAIDPTGTFLLAANQDSDNLVVFRIDPDSGRLSPTGQVVEVPTPVCVKMIPVAAPAG